MVSDSWKMLTDFFSPLFFSGVKVAILKFQMWRVRSDSQKADKNIIINKIENKKKMKIKTSV